MDHSPLLVFLVLGMCLLVDCRSKPDSRSKSGSKSGSRSKSAKCDVDLPSIAGAVYEIDGNTAHYWCVCPATAVTQADSSTSSAAVAVYDCSKKVWRNTHNNEPLACRVDGGWSDWTAWDDCTATCGSSTQTRTRTCDSPEPLNGGMDCAGPVTETDDCCVPACPVDGEWGNWGNFGDCNPPPVCVLGTSPTRNRTRECDNPAPAYGGDDCVGNDEDTETGCTVVANTATCTNYKTSPACGQVDIFALRICLATGSFTSGLIQSIWVKTEMSTVAGTCACGFNFAPIGNLVHTHGGCKALFHVCYA